MTRSPGLGLAALGFLELEPPSLVDVAHASGFSSVSLRAWAAVPGGPEYPLLDGDRVARETRARLDAAGVAILQIELVSLARDVAIDRYRPSLEGGAALGAERVVACGDDPDPSVLADRLATLCDVAADLGLSVDLEFMPFRPLATWQQALDLVERVGRPNARIMVDALHLFRSGGAIVDLAAAPGRIDVCQLCDALLAAPPRDELASEARGRRLLPGSGELPLSDLVAALPAGTRFAAEVPNEALFAGLPPLERARLAYVAASALLEG